MAGNPSTPPLSRHSQIPDYGGDGVDYGYQFVTRTLFADLDAVFEWAKAIALQIGFVLVKSSKKTQRDGRPYVYLRCNRWQSNRSENRDMTVAVRKKTRSQGCNCPFVIKARFRDQRDGWEVVVVGGTLGMHNHPLIVYLEGHRQLSYLSPGARKLVRQLTLARGKPSHIMAAIKDKYLTIYPTIRQIYNERMKIRRKDSEGRDVVQQFLHLAHKEEYVQWIRADRITGIVDHAFLAHPIGVNMLRTWPHVILMDFTYKTNSYNMPFFEIVGMTPTNHTFLIAYAFMRRENRESYSWVFRRLKNFFGVNVNPTAVVTDREAGLLTPLSDIFPNSSHLLCTWHINKDVEGWVTKQYKNKELGERFKRGRWKDIIDATSEDEFNNAVRNMKDIWGNRVGLVGYVEDTWLGPHRQKFVRAWTNQVFHLGQTTTNRVESQHSVLKSWLGTSTGALDTIFSTVHRALEHQQIEIRYYLEDSRRRHAGSQFPFQHLIGIISNYALQILKEEQKRMRELSDQVYERCGCALQTTHGLPCACMIYTAIQAETRIYRDQVHPFWRTLVIGDGVDTPIFAEESAQDAEHFRALVDEVLGSDPAVIRSISHLVDGELHPGSTDIGEPDVNEATRGRPRGTGSTSRNLSGWEYAARDTGRGRGRSRGRGRGKRDSSSTVNIPNTSGRRMSITDYWYARELPRVILEYVECVIDVIGDGNCGFRVVADWVFGDQEQWPFIREVMANEVAAKPIYSRIYFDGVATNVARIRWDGGEVGEEHWMTVMEDLIPIAQLWSAVVSLFMVGTNGSTNPCITVLPWKASSTAAGLARELAIGYIHSKHHFIRLHIEHLGPMPPIAQMWRDIRDRSVVGWENQYSDRIRRWDDITR